MFEGFRRVLGGDSRCILAFRHAYGVEPQILGWFIICRLRSLARKAGYSFPRPPHTLFIYGYEVLRWGGPLVRELLPRIGAMPVHHTKIDSQGMARIYKALLDGPYPLAMAPEGQVTYNAETVPPLEQGAIRLGFRAAEQLERENKTCPVEILPVSIHFRYSKSIKKKLEGLLKKIEKVTGFTESYKNDGYPGFTQRLRACRDYLLSLNEGRYGIVPDETLDFSQRIDRILEAALDRAERTLGIKPLAAGIIPRVYHIRQICWDRIFLPGRNTLDALAPAERALLDLRAGEAWHTGRHMELADFVWYFRSPLPPEDAPLYQKIEYTENLWDFANRTMGGSFASRGIHIYPRRVIIRAAPAMDLTDRLPEYRRDKKAAIQQAMDSLTGAYQECIEEVKETN